MKIDFKENTQLNLELQRHAYLSKKDLTLKITLDTKFDEIEQYFAEVKEVKVIEYKEKIYNHFYALRNKVDIKRETVLARNYENKNEIEEINRLSTNLIKQLDSTEDEFHKNLMNEIESHTNDMINVEYKRRLNEILRNISLSGNDLEKLKIECETKMKKIQSELVLIDTRFNARLNENMFVEYNGEQEKLLGGLYLNKFQNETNDCINMYEDLKGKVLFEKINFLTFQLERVVSLLIFVI